MIQALRRVGMTMKKSSLEVQMSVSEELIFAKKYDTRTSDL